MVKNGFVFRMYLRFSRQDRKIQAGSYRLGLNRTARDLAADLQKGRLDKWVTIAEGLRKEQTARKFADEFGIDEQEFLAESREGYLFPDTYLVPVDADYKRVLGILQNNFDTKVTPEILAAAAGLGLNTDELINLAAIIERETRNGEERPIISGIMHNRLKAGMSLGVDATIQYALGYSEEEESWWRKTLTFEDLQINSPYNTRKNRGLPPGPICSPGLSAIKAAAKPTQTDYYYYLHDPQGTIHYAKTLAEHEENKAKYLN
jgi:UPF0755 protein